MLRTARTLYLHGCHHLSSARSSIAVAGISGGDICLKPLQLPNQRSCFCNFHTSPSHLSSYRDHRKQFMNFRIPNIFKWLTNQIEIATLKREWDPSFSTDAFKSGVNQALATSTSLISRREWGELRGLLTQKAINNLRATQWSDAQFKNLAIETDRILVTAIDKVSLQSIVDRKYCDIDVTVVGTRLPHTRAKNNLIVLEYNARFHRDYTYGMLPEWTISALQLRKLKVYKTKDGR